MGFFNINSHDVKNYLNFLKIIFITKIATLSHKYSVEYKNVHTKLKKNTNSSFLLEF